MAALAKTIASGLFLCLVLGSCGGKAVRWEHRVHVVRAGEALFAIAFRYGLHEADLAAWNRLDNPDLIFPGQTLRLTPPPGYRAVSTRPVVSPGSRASPPAATGPPGISPVWRWPAEGDLLARFGDASSGGQGIDITGKKGNPVFAAAAGAVVYSGSGLLGYGKLIILKHNETYLSAYGHNDELLVREGDNVATGQRIARMGIGPGDRAVLHFEIRMKGKPVDPMQHLPSR